MDEVEAFNFLQLQELLVIVLQEIMTTNTDSPNVPLDMRLQQTVSLQCSKYSKEPTDFRHNQAQYTHCVGVTTIDGCQVFVNLTLAISKISQLTVLM